MGCQFSQNDNVRVPINKSIVHLLQTEQNKTLFKKLGYEGEEIYTMKLNFRGDTIMHYACTKNNIELIQFLKNRGADFTIKNYSNQTPSQMTKNEDIIKLIGFLSLPTCESSTEHNKNISESAVLTECNVGDVKIIIPEINEANDPQIASTHSFESDIAEEEANSKSEPKNIQINSSIRSTT